MANMLSMEKKVYASGKEPKPQKPQGKKEERDSPDVYDIITIGNVLMGIAAIIIGLVLMSDSYHSKALYFFGGVGAGLMWFTFAAVSAACGKYLRKRH